jgi:molybdopterin synthase sulfur carrier subunit
MIRIILPHHLQLLAGVNHEVQLAIEGTATIGTLLDTLEMCYPVLRGTIRDHASRERRDFLRFFACGEDYSLEPAATPLPAAVIQGTEPFRIVGALAGG